ncbi:hypothetical protein FRC0457_00563 [Corynebacterium diphtheriae]|nr:hypothetical protein CIP107502_00541 [Corynebacterium diphtheriae]CAB0635602.1 hypothetical protein CIP107567_00574 [Corynebacterium diphtheriae]CAB0941892.1 hypothetical protein FRC0457_00563 [Corynebacterium diphtheriae]
MVSEGGAVPIEAMIAQDVEDCDEAEVWLALPDIFDKPQDGGDGGGVGGSHSYQCRG